MPSEWFFNSSTRQLFFMPNSTEPGQPPAADLQFIVPKLHRLLTVIGTRDAPVQNVTIRGIGLRDSKITFMEPWGVPSGGDEA